MRASRPTRRKFLKRILGTLAAGVACPAVFCEPQDAPAAVGSPAKPRSPNERLGIGAIGMRYQGTVITEVAMPYGDVVGICDVDKQHGETARKHFGVKAGLYEDFRKLLDRKDVDMVTIGVPDHWHTAIAVAACRAGKHVYCEKPLTLTVDEGKLLTKVVKETGRVFQVGTWQRSDHRFRLACELVHQGRIGKLRKVTVTLGKNPTGGPFEETDPPPQLNWKLWQGQTPLVPYIKERCHYTFRWWYEYSGGQMTDWGAHHMDIAHWGMGMQYSGPVEIDGKATFPDIPNGYNVATEFGARLVYPNGLELVVRDKGENGILFEGEKGTVFVNRAVLRGTAVDELESRPLERKDFTLYGHDNLTRPERVQKRPATMNHMGNFVDCMETGNLPVSDVVSQHRSVSACHVANLSMRLGRKLRWDPEKELFVGDDEANRWLSREQRDWWTD